MKRGHSPQRTCLGCGSRDHKKALLRIVAEGGDLELDRNRGGRGGYLHDAEGCWEAFLRRKSLYRAFRAEFGREPRKKLIEGLRERNREAKDG